MIKGNKSSLQTMNYQLPIINYQLPITNYQLPTTNYQLMMFMLLMFLIYSF
ncbi:MAG: hypothetical protein AAF630_19320 [Cyanobacteria bacterium P01_C01_bin.38]